MFAGGALSRGVGGLHHTAAIPAFPENLFRLLEYGFALDRLDQLVKASLVPSFDVCNLTKNPGGFSETFLRSILCKAGVKRCPFRLFACSRSL